MANGHIMPQWHGGDPNTGYYTLGDYRLVAMGQGGQGYYTPEEGPQAGWMHRAVIDPQTGMARTDEEGEPLMYVVPTVSGSFQRGFLGGSSGRQQSPYPMYGSGPTSIMQDDIGIATKALPVIGAPRDIFGYNKGNLGLLQPNEKPWYQFWAEDQKQPNWWQKRTWKEKLTIGAIISTLIALPVWLYMNSNHAAGVMKRFNLDLERLRSDATGKMQDIEIDSERRQI